MVSYGTNDKTVLGVTNLSKVKEMGIGLKIVSRRDGKNIYSTEERSKIIKSEKFGKGATFISKITI